MVEMLKTKIQIPPSSKLGELLERCLFAGKLFLKAVELHHTDVSQDLLKFSMQAIFRLFHYNLSFEYPDPDFLEDGSRLVAKLAKKYPELNEVLKLNYDLATISEEELAEGLQNIKVS